MKKPKFNKKIAFFSITPIAAVATLLSIKKSRKNKLKKDPDSLPQKHPDHEPDLFI